MTGDAVASAVLDGLPAAGHPWRLELQCWSPSDALRWGVLLARSESTGRWMALSHRPLPDLLRQRLEGLARAPLPWHEVDEPSMSQAIAQAALAYRALDRVEEGAPAGEAIEADDGLAVLELDTGAHPVVQLLNAILHDALQEGASDVHLESTGWGGVVKFRIDGVMLPVRRIEGRAQVEQMVSRLKVMAELDIGERRLPQDGRFRIRLAQRTVDFRLSIMPASHGEDAVVRILDKSRIQMGGDLSLTALGFDPALCSGVRDLAAMAHGMLLVTGPTGSGKTTTLYATLSEITTGREKVITIEDPVEYRLEGVVQIPVNERKGLTFARGLRSILRHDPDRIMVGEIRDPETAQIAVQAALTGHLVFSTVHANGVLDVVGRFMHMGLDLYHVVSALNGVLAQRLLRQVCPHCAGPDEPPPAALERVRWSGPSQGLRRGAGCGHCRGTGYSGRRAYAELMRMDDGLRDMIASRAPLQSIKQAARQRGLTPLREAALEGARRGETTIEEVLRVTLDDE